MKHRLKSFSNYFSFCTFQLPGIHEWFKVVAALFFMCVYSIALIGFLKYIS
jgi:hypothetical protein